MTHRVHRSLDTRGELCPRPIIDLAEELKSMPQGSILEVVSDDLAFPPDLRAWCAGTGNEVLDLSTEGRIHVARVRKGRG
jgi:TusA-related sulfurtransferase